jgi:protein tyrosine phosphatase (PTP) superfamily phosphohydrolase (DUF442 family)
MGDSKYQWLGKKSGRAALLAGLALLTAQLLTQMPAAWADDKPENLVVWREGLTSSAQPNQAFLAEIDKKGYDLVINLAPPQSMGSIETEGALVGKRGARYVNIPVDFKKPTLDDFKFFTEMVKAGAGKKILVHCQVNLRGSSFVFLYRVTQEGAPMEEKLNKLTGVWRPDPVWKKFIEDTLSAYGKKAEIL